MTAMTSVAQEQALLNVSAPCGSLSGLRQGAVGVFKGIPYAKPPVGALRWRPPQRAQRWSGTRLAVSAGPAAMQELPPRSTLMYRFNNDDARPLVMSEDCLYLNVWSPDPSTTARLPVLVWVHGGGNRTGHGDQKLFDGTRLAARGIVVVTINMRLGALGFLSLPELAAEDDLGASGNYGLQDAVAALAWVQDNIAAFGGDAHRVTLGGQSSGAAIVSHLMAAASTRGRFHAAIGQSVAGVFRHEGRHLMGHAEAARQGAAAMAPLGVSLDALRDLPATAFLRIPPQGVVVDGRVLTEDSTDVFLKGRQAAVPLLAGWNTDEGSLYATAGALSDLKLQDLGADGLARLAQEYPAAFSDGWSLDRRALVGDRRFIYPVWRWARTHAETCAAPTWAYQFDHQLPLPPDLPRPPDGGADYGCFHTAELPFTWDNLATRHWAWREVDHQLARRMADSWVRFICAGDPNGDGLPRWERFNAAHDAPILSFGATAQASSPLHRQAFEVFDAAYFPPCR